MRPLRVILTILSSCIFFAIVLHLNYEQQLHKEKDNVTALSKVTLPIDTTQPSTPWYKVLLFDHDFVISEKQIFVVLTYHEKQVIAVNSAKIWSQTLSSPITILSFMFVLLLFVNSSRQELRIKKQKTAIRSINNDIESIFEYLELNHNILHHGGDVAQLSHSVHTIAEHIQRLKLQSDSQVFQDKLTKLIDRHAYIEHLGIQLSQAEKKGQQCGLLFIDLDGFKQVNDSFGHSFGDEILIQVAARLTNIVRQFQLQDPHPIHGLEQNLSRLGGDEFSIFIPNLHDPKHCTDISQTVLKEIERDFILGNKLVKISASIGIAVYPESAATPNALLQMSDVAMYRAKNDGRGIYRIYSPEMGSKMRRYHYLLEELRNAITTQSFYLSFQPIVHVEDCAIDYFEALVRWEHPVEGLISPAEFIPIAEESNLILELGDWILLESCRQMSAWHNAGMKKVKISVNVSGIQLKHKQLFPWVMEALEKTGLPATALMLEITESTLITASDDIIAELERCRTAGISIAIDDFGTGFSSLSTLADLPIDVIKIDKLFITQASDNTKYRKILSSISELGQKLGLKIVAEGVEQLEQFELVKKLGICCVQGYLVSRPESSVNVGSKVLKGNVNHLAATGTSIWLPESR